MSDYKPTREQFLADVAGHRMTVRRDDGMYRHAEFRGQNGWHHWFEIVTWPNALCIRGDMGTWTFSRIEDMFQFFRHERISPSYWAEKLQYGSGSGAYNSARVFSINALRSQVVGYLDNYELTDDQRKEVIQALEEDVLEMYSDNEEWAAVNALLEFKKHGVRFDPCDGPFGKEWSYHYIWCLWAIVWGIQQWDAREGT